MSMRRGRRELQGSVVVLVGASSGVGRAAALEFARAGARLALAARDGAALADVAAECRALGAEAIATSVDITQAEDLDRLVEIAKATYGHIDTWVNAAAGLLAGRIDRTPVE